MDWNPVLISLKTATVSMAFTFVLGLWAARIVVSLHSERMKAWIDGILTLPLVLPPTVAGFFLLLLFSLRRPFGLPPW